MSVVTHKFMEKRITTDKPKKAKRMLRKEEVMTNAKAKIEAKLKKRQLKMTKQNNVPKKIEPKRKRKPHRSKKVNATYQSDIKRIYVDVSEAEENKRREKEVLDSVAKTVDKRTSNTKESCYLRNN